MSTFIRKYWFTMSGIPAAMTSVAATTIQRWRVLSPFAKSEA
jgi:hypothetical protein